MDIKKKESRDLFVMDFVQFVSAPQSHAKRFRKIKKTMEICPNNLSELQWMKLWRGFYYAIWYSEMRKGGEEMIQELAQWTNSSFLLSGFKSMSESWEGIDEYRIDKYMFLIRMMLRNVFKQHISAMLEDKLLFEENPFLVNKNNKNDEANDDGSDNHKPKKIKQINREKQKLEQEKILDNFVKTKANVIDYIFSVTNTSIGLFLHLCDIYHNELQNSLTEVKDDQIKITLYYHMLIPFGKWLALINDQRLRKAIRVSIFDQFFDEIILKESIETRIDILNKFQQPLIDIASHTELGKNRNCIYMITDKIKSKIAALKNKNKDKVKLKRKIIGYDRTNKKVKYELTTNTPFVRSIVPLPVM